METSGRLRIAAILVLCLATGGAAIATAARTDDGGLVQLSDRIGATTDDAVLRWDSDRKRLGIGTAAPATTLDVRGAVTAERYLYQSDARLKAGTAPLSGQLGKITALEPVSYSYRADPAHMRRLGLLAQNVEAEFPEAVHTDAQGVKYVDYPALIAPLIGAVRELEAANEDQARAIEAMRAVLQSGEAARGVD